MEIEKIDCTSCGNLMPALRKEKYGYSFCVECSNVSPKVGRVIVIGEGDHTATELEIVDQDTAQRLYELENLGRKVVPLSAISLEAEEVVGGKSNSYLKESIEEEIEVEEDTESLEEVSEDLEDIEEEE